MTRKTIYTFILAPLVGCIIPSMCVGANSAETAKVVQIVAKRYEYSPSEITLKKGIPVLIMIRTEDRSHGFYSPELNLKADILPGKVTTLNFSPQKTGKFDFFCDIFCGSGHENMAGKIIVVD